MLDTVPFYIRDLSIHGFGSGGWGRESPGTNTWGLRDNWAWITPVTKDPDTQKEPWKPVLLTALNRVICSLISSFFRDHCCLFFGMYLSTPPSKKKQLLHIMFLVFFSVIMPWAYSPHSIYSQLRSLVGGMWFSPFLLSLGFLCIFWRRSHMWKYFFRINSWRWIQKFYNLNLNRVCHLNLVLFLMFLTFK